MDLALADVSSLRRQIGVVLQDNMLFNRSIRENIALSDPGAPIDNVIQAARLAGAHESFWSCPRPMTRWWANTVLRSLAASGNASPSPER